MSVVPMQKVRLCVHESDVDQVLEVIQKSGAIEFKAVADENLGESEGEFIHADLLPRVQHAVQFLTPYAPKVGLWKTLREGSREELTEEELKKKTENLDVVVPLVVDFERLQVEFAEVNENLRKLEEQHALLNTWKSLEINVSDLETTRTKTLLIAISGAEKTLNDILTEGLSEVEEAHLLTEVSKEAVALTIANDNKAAGIFDSALANLNIEVITALEGTETPEVEFAAVSEKLAGVKGELALLHDQAEHFAITHYKQLQVSGEILSWHKQRFDVVSNGAATKYTVVLDGWLKETERDAIEADLFEQDLTVAIINLDLEEGEEGPVEIENNSLVKPFEAVTRLYGMPGSKDLDPTPFLAGFFFLFFGLSLTDVGYGLFLMAVATIVITLFKVSDTIKLFAKLLFAVGLATVFAGALFGGYLGLDAAKLPQVLQNIAFYDPIGDPLPVFYLALSLGVFQVMVGMLLKVYSEHRNGRLVGGIIEQGPWFFTFCMGILALLTSIGYVALIPMAVIIKLIYVGVAMVAISGFYRGEGGFFGKLIASLARLYDSIGYFSDILSYSRLLALGLATTALAFAVNLIAGMVVETPYVGYILAGIILVIGHMFNLAVNTLGAFIHSARLQFVEFFGKFIVGTGRSFSPLVRSEDHLTVKDK